jgi:hypothetical protein
MEDGGGEALDQDGTCTWLVDSFAARLSEPPEAWLPDLVDGFVRNELTDAHRRTVISDLAWRARDDGLPIPTGAGSALAPPADLYFAWYVGSRLRFDFRFRELGLIVPRWRAAHPGDAFIMALDAFARLALQDPRGVELFDAAIAAPDSDHRVQFVCLHGMWFATDIPDQGERMLALCEQMLSQGLGGHVLHYRRAFALRRLGRTNDALRSIDEAIGALDPSESGFLKIHQDYVRERELIVTSEMLSRESQHLLEAARSEISASVDERVKAAQGTISEALLKLVEVLGLFVTLAGFVAASGVSLLRAERWWEITVSVALAGLGSLLFFAMLRVIVGSYRRA